MTNLTAPQITALHALAAIGGWADLANDLHAHIAEVESLRLLGYVVRSERGRDRITLTAAGQAVLDALEEAPAAAPALTIPQQQALQDIENTTKSIRRLIAQMQRELTTAVESIDKGERFWGMGSHGPLGAQSSFDLGTLSATLQAQVVAAKYLGLNDEQITAVYKTA